MRADYRLFCWIALAGLTCAGQEKDPNAVWKKAGADEGLRQAFERVIYRLEDSGPGRYKRVNPPQRLALEFTSDALGRGCPVGQMTRNPSGPGGMTVTLNENAVAFDGIVQLVLDVIGKVRVGPPEDMYPPPTRLGAPNGLGKFWLARVSTTRQGVMGTNTRELGADEAAI